MNLISPQLLAFQAVVENKTVHGAAAALNLTQTAVTQRIRNLETHLKTTLFIRSRRGMELTHEGKALLRYCHSVRALEGEALAEITGSGLSSEVEIKIAGPSSIMRSRVVPALAHFTRSYPNVLLHFIFNDSENLQQQLRSGDCDFAIMTSEHVTPEMASKVLMAETYVLVCCSDWQARDLEDILEKETIIDFYSSDKMTFQYLENFNLLDKANKSRHFVNNIDSMAELVETGMGYTTLTEEIAKEHIRAKKLILLNQKKTFKVQPVLVWHPRSEMPNYFSDLVQKIE